MLKGVLLNESITEKMYKNKWNIKTFQWNGTGNLSVHCYFNNVLPIHCLQWL